MPLPGIEEKVAFLSKPETYPNHVERVETKQTHMSWVFLTDTNAWKLKKPVRTEFLDFSTPKARRFDCEYLIVDHASKCHVHFVGSKNQYIYNKNQRL